MKSYQSKATSMSIRESLRVNKDYMYDVDLMNSLLSILRQLNYSESV